jgi:hypothetical protein
MALRIGADDPMRKISIVAVSIVAREQSRLQVMFQMKSIGVDL